MDKQSFYHSITVLDTETTHLLPAEAEIVELAAARWSQQSQWQITDRLFGARGGIPPAASAKNNISPRMIQDQPYWDQCTREIKQLLAWDTTRWFVAHNCVYDQAVLAAAWQRCDSPADAQHALDTDNWICTWRLSKHILSHDFADIEYGLNYLRYLLDLAVPDDHVNHRAGADTLLCALLLDQLIEIALQLSLLDPCEPLGPQLHDLCWRTLPITVWPMGKYRGVQMADIPTDYWAWALQNLPALQENHTAYDRDLAENLRVLLASRLEHGHDL